MKCKTIVLWWLVNGEEPKQLQAGEKKIEALMPLISTLFPGINYYSMTGFFQVMHQCVVPALKKLFPDFLSMHEHSITVDETTEVVELLPSNGYEWQNSPEWKAKRDAFLTA